jgi:perosamine synthetase
MNVSAADRHRARGPMLEAYLETGFNYRMTDLQAAMGIVQAGRLPSIVARRRELAATYHELLAGLPGVRAVTDPPHGTTNYQSFWVVCDGWTEADRDAALAGLAARGISARRGIMAAHREPAYREHPHRPLPATEHLTSRSLILPLWHDLTADDLRTVVDGLRDALPASVAA